MYNESDLRTIFYAQKGGMKTYQLAQLMSITEDECDKMLNAAQEKFGGVRREKEEVQKDRRPYFKHRVIPEKISQPFTRHPAKYDNKSAEERIEEYLNMDV